MEYKKYGGQSEIPLEAGTTTVTIRVANMETFPCIYVDGIIERVMKPGWQMI